MEDYGTPSEMSGEARDGFEVVVATFKDVDDDASLEDLQTLVHDVSAADNKKMPRPSGPGRPRTARAAAAPSDDAS